MYCGKALFVLVTSLLALTTLAQAAPRYGGDRLVRSPRCTEHHCVMAFAHHTDFECSCDIAACLVARSSKLFRPGFRAPVRRSTLSDAREADPEIQMLSVDNNLSSLVHTFVSARISTS